MNALEAARRLARRICDDAEWRDGLCTWTGPGGVPMDADLYEGTAGVAWFLGHVGAVTGDARPARTATGAARHAVDRVAHRRLPRSGLYAGDLGALWGVATVGTLLDEPELVERALGLVPAVQSRLPATGHAGHDLLGGTAGNLLALVALAALRGEPVGERSRIIAAGLATAADPMPHGVAWPQPDPTGPGSANRPAATRFGREPVHPVGMAHGASGVARAMLEFASTGATERFGDVVRDALAFEHAWFDRDSCGWRDPQTRQLTGLSWCRGSVGIGLTRLRGIQLAPGPRLEAEAGAALASVHTALAGLLSAGVRTPRPRRVDFSVCHGVMGAVDLLVHAAEVLGVDEHREAAVRVVDLALATVATDGSWTCGTVDGSESSGLLLGLAGIGAACLRVACPGSVPPVGLLAGVPAMPYSVS
ncbi:lanthionine synthetase LanC family protein [Geodermatophilus sp. SYSU D00691]